MCVLIKEYDGFRVLLAGFQEVLVGLQLGQRVSIEVIDASAPADGEETAVLMRHLHQIGKQCPAAGSGHRA